MLETPYQVSFVTPTQADNLGSAVPNRPAASPRVTPAPPSTSSSLRPSVEPSRTSPPESSSPAAGPSKRRRTSSSREAEPVPSDNREADVAAEDEEDRFAGMSDLEIFRLVTAPPEIPGVSEWGIPPEVESSKADLRLRVRVPLGPF